MKTLSVLLFACLVSCAQKAFVPGTIPTAPRQSASGVAAAQSVQSATAGTAVISARLEGQINALASQSTSLRAGMQAALAEADRLRKQKTASEGELDGMWKQLTELTQRNLFLETETAAAKTTANEQKASRDELEKTVDSMALIALENATELAALREQRVELAATVTRVNKEAVKLVKANAAMAADHATMTRVRFVIGSIIVAAVVWLVVQLLIRFAGISVPFPFNLLFFRKP